MEKEFDVPSVKIYLHKVIPMGAGLGGGSSDGAFTLRLLNELFELRLTDSLLEQLASRLGSDCAFFIKNKPVFATGRGDQFEPVTVHLEQYRVVLVVPPFPVSTDMAYAGITPAMPQTSVKNVENVPVEEWTQFLVNDFESSVFLKFPKIKDLKEKMYKSGAVYASMSGSGSAVYGLFSKDQKTDIEFPGMSVWTMEP
jgi:4-diphosphocytidyl-2-C-methyl-D-erythritol kinase